MSCGCAGRSRAPVKASSRGVNCPKHGMAARLALAPIGRLKALEEPWQARNPPPQRAGPQRRAKPERRTAGRLSTKARAPRAPARSAWCCWSRWRWSAPPPASSMSSRLTTPKPISWRCWRCSAPSASSRCSRSPPASCSCRAGASGNPLLKAVVDNAFDGIVVTDQSGRVFYANATYLDLIGASRQQRRAADRAGLHRRSRTFPNRSTACSRPRARAAGCRRKCAFAGASANGGALAAPARAPARREQARRAHDGVVDRRRDARPRARRKTCSRNCSTPSIISTTRRPASSRSMPRATSSISTPRSPTGSITIWRKSAPVRSSSAISSPARAQRCSTTLNAAPGEVKTEVLDLDLQDARRQAGAGAPVPQSRVRRRRHARRLAHAGAQPRQGRRQRFRSARRKCASCASSRTRRWRLPPSTRPAASRAAMRALPSAFEGMLKGERRARSSRWWPSATARRSKPPSARRARGRATSRRSKRRLPAVPSAGRISSSPPSRRRTATARRRSSTRWRPPRSARWRTASISSRRWNRSASSPAASRTTSTTCSPPS